MQNAIVGGWARQASFSTEVLAPLHALNVQFLDLVGARAGGWRISGALDLPGGASERMGPMSASERAAAAHCPYALFDLRFDDESYWRERLAGAADWRVAEGGAEEETAKFVRLALFYAWHVASTSRYSAQVLLGMSDRTADAFRGTTLNCIPELAVSERANLSARFLNCSAYWSALVSAAARKDEIRLRKVQLFGLQLAAASRLA